ncbi:hypothetical protein IX307_001364 [Bacteroides pyogenes]|uniref:Uncharacterized protein n=1 Tax=Bacteroides pyogenes TaxID=310300 RepID=A0A5D3EHH2_9BACE|nr:hypothetical protein [Bacteroides pyogenes]MBR8720212.1 hypothetical protein [Bacteroides pyogenes]MBR8725813.1 hypothetical protein [Bacteroides pyogenes]MBR8739479.1 hypothetical protein [Bacteroides pyogenes]MBR8754972.1 hypothetical protein [Bacteroides pyogenes]MBR8787043.1 hypothetical protein [Bacteroides pyogenes]
MDTIRDTILAFPGLEDTEDAFLNRVLALRGLDGTKPYSTEIDGPVCLAAADIYKEMANAPDFMENKLSKTYPRNYFVMAAKRLYIENGEPEKALSVGKRIVIKGKAGNRW